MRGWLFQHILEIKSQTCKCLIFGAKKHLRISSLDSFYPESISLIHWFCKVVVLHILLISYHWMSVFMTAQKSGGWLNTKVAAFWHLELLSRSPLRLFLQLHILHCNELFLLKTKEGNISWGIEGRLILLQILSCPEVNT